MRTPKIEALERLIGLIRTHNSNLAIESIKPLDNSPLDSNGWLSGLWDADGGFHLTTRIASDHAIGSLICIKAKLELRIKANLELRSEYHYEVPTSLGTCLIRYLPYEVPVSYLDIMTAVAKFMNCNLRKVHRVKDGRSYFTYIAESSCMNSNAINVINPINTTNTINAINAINPIVVSYFNSFP